MTNENFLNAFYMALVAFVLCFCITRVSGCQERTELGWQDQIKHLTTPEVKDEDSVR